MQVAAFKDERNEGVKGVAVGGRDAETPPLHMLTLPLVHMHAARVHFFLCDGDAL